MNAIGFIKENYTFTNSGEDYMCNHFGQLVGAEDIAEEYNQYKLKLLGIANVAGQSEQLVCPNCGGEGFIGKGTTEILPCLSCFGSGEKVN